jgi:SAM-dependent methyltransferase
MSSDVSTEKIRFQCNICDARNDLPRSQFGREIPTCAGCGSTVRRGALMRILSREIFGMDLRISDFPVLKGIRGLGMSDSLDYAKRLAEKFDYRNTYYDREPKFDITLVHEHELGSYDFVISSEVLEHVVAPVERAFKHLHRLLKPNGVLLLTVPYRPEGSRSTSAPCRITDLHR